MFSSNDRGIVLALLTALVSGVSIFINKFAVGFITPPLVFTATKNLGVGLILLTLLLVSGKWRKIKQLDGKNVFRLVMIGIIGGALPFYLFFTGISLIPAINAALIHKTLVIWVAILAWPFLKEKLSKGQGLAVLLIFLGNLLIGGFQGFEFSKGELFIMLATVLWAVENIIAKKVLDKVDPDLVTTARMGFGSLILVGASLIVAPQALAGVFSLNAGQLFWMLATALALFAYVSTWYRALKYAPATTVATVLASSTIVTNILSAIFITHTWDFRLLPQAGLILSGVILFWWFSRRESVRLL